MHLHFSASTEVPINSTVSDTLGPTQFKYFNYPFPQEGLTLRVYLRAKDVIMYVSKLDSTIQTVQHMT